MDSPETGALGTTFGGNPVSCAAALAALKLIEEQKLCARAEELGARFEQRAREWQKQWPLIGEIRRLGAMCAIELVRTQDTRVPADVETKAIVAYCHEHGVILISAGSFGNVIRLLMPLVITDEQLDEALGVLESAIECVSRAQGGVHP
jgi:4-aminobutyrate aminotransferase/(S)-3-amino-2-methylpropionate transaminase